MGIAKQCHEDGGKPSKELGLITHQEPHFPPFVSVWL